jgi:TRAP-type C4-dicarboxylate transport system permease small subunit
MNTFLDKVRKLSELLNNIAGASLTLIVLLTMSDVVLRYFKKPIPGTYEIVTFLGAMVIGFSVAYTSWIKGHIFVDFLILRFSRTTRNLFYLFTRCLGIFLFFLIGWNLIVYGMDVFRTGEVSLTLRFPYYPVIFGVGFACFVESLVLVCDVLKIIEGKHE